jgi:ribonuclease P/MRP protein subunit RPP40
MSILSLITLEGRRTRGDLIETNKILTGKEDANESAFFKTYNGVRYLREHSHKLNVERSSLKVSRQFSSQRVVKGWSSLPGDVVEAQSFNAFESKLDGFKKE